MQRFTVTQRPVTPQASLVHLWSPLHGWPSPPRYDELERVSKGTPVIMRATTWGFPDTRTILGFIKDRTATFTVMEDDTGRGILLGPGADEVDELDGVEIRSNKADQAWTTRFEEDLDTPIIGVAHAELYFDVRIEEESCRSKIIRVPSM